MSTTTLNFNFTLNTSLQVGDVVYYIEGEEPIKQIGPSTSIVGSVVTCDSTLGDTTLLSNDSYIFFSKDNEINTSGLVGYYAEVEFVNNSTEDAELFAVNSEIFVSSN
jgi:hypothetical protein